MKNLTYRLHKSNQTVFTAREIALLLGETDTNIVKSKINYYVKKGEIIALRRGVYVKDAKYNEYELANKIYSPSYISFDTVLSSAGTIFQYDSRIYLASYLAREIKVNEVDIVYRKIKDEILLSPNGVIYKEGVAWATLERAFLDTIYLDGNRYFDNLDSIDFKKAEEILPIYNSKILKLRFKKYVKNHFT